MDLLDRIVAADQAAFLAVNGAGSPALDPVMLAVSDLRMWVPLYLGFLVLVKLRWGWKGLWIAVPVIALMVLCSDTGSVLLFKNTVLRLRPCHEAALAGLVHLVPDGCGGRYGFVSSHAANHFAIAALMAGMLQRRPRWAALALFAWAGLIAYSRVYLGVHYPADVIVGGLYGTFIGTMAFVLFRSMHQRLIRA
ncbi:MAG: phosphatase PAP2 family protein [Flavobacteriales bacterium]|nr:phosphatase PAP2 family protein [Flavobacteriales bacterium]